MECRSLRMIALSDIIVDKTTKTETPDKENENNKPNDSCVPETCATCT